MFDPEIGRATRWKKGYPSPNPGGRPKFSVVSAYLRCALKAGDAEKIARSLLNRAKSGDLRAIVEVIDRTEGRAKQSLELDIEKPEPDSPFRGMSREELEKCCVDHGLESIALGLNFLREPRGFPTQHLIEQAPRLRELHQELTSLIETLDEARVTDDSGAISQVCLHTNTTG